MALSHAQDAEAPTADQAIKDEVEALVAVRNIGPQHGPSLVQRQYPGATATQTQPLPAVGAQLRLVRRFEALPRQQIPWSAIAEPATFRHQFVQPVLQRSAIRSCQLMMHDLATHTKQCKCHTPAQPPPA